MQAQQLIDMASKHFLLQEVLQPTHSVEVLDLVFSNNCELVSGVKVENWTAFTDHRLVVVSTTYQTPTEEAVQEEQFLCDAGRRYANLDFHRAPWQDIMDELQNIDWTDLDRQT